jgi:hypothetical protein
MRELLDLAEERVDNILSDRGYIYLSEVHEIWRDVVQEDKDRFEKELRKGNVEFTNDWSK